MSPTLEVLVVVAACDRWRGNVNTRGIFLVTGKGLLRIGPISVLVDDDVEPFVQSMMA